MTFTMFLGLIGGLALFLYGMELLGTQLRILSGSRLEALLRKLTSNRLKAVMLGLAVTAVIQSSSATTVMVVGFVNSGIMQLQQTVGIIMGANIGTTVTAWILSLTGLSGDSFIVTLLKPSTFVPILAAVGIVLVMIHRRDRTKDIGLTLLGFALLMYGMEMMSAAMNPLSDNPAFTSLMVRFRNPILGVAAGAILTAIIQSSSASVGILQALALTGNMSYAACLPIILGQNIGTCITAILSSIGAETNAKRAALIHLFFNLIATTIFLITFYIFNSFMHFAFMEEVATPVGIALIHSIFNIGATVLLFPFADQLTDLTKVVLKDPPQTHPATVEEQLFRRLDERFIQEPALAVAQAKEVLAQMSNYVEENVNQAISLGINGQKFNRQTYESIFKTEELIDTYSDKLGTYLVRLSQQPLNEQDNSTVNMLLFTLSDLTSIDDYSNRIAEAFRGKDKDRVSFTPEAEEELAIFLHALQRVTSDAIDVLVRQDEADALRIEPLGEVVHDLTKKLRKRHLKRVREGRCTVEHGIHFLEIVNSADRISEHCSHIGSRLIELKAGELDMHEYKKTIRSDERFDRLYREYRTKYKLPPKK